MNRTKKAKIILLLILMLTSLFVIGCSTHGKEDSPNVTYEFCPGKIFYSASQSNKMLYYATNQSTIHGSAVYDPNGNIISGSTFLSPVNVSDDNGGMWVADGFVEDVKNNVFDVGTYTLKFSLKNSNHSAEKHMEWVNFPTWKSTPSFVTDTANTTRTIEVVSSGITTGSNTSGYDIRYRLKIYVYRSNASQLFGQSKMSNSASIIYSLPKVASSIELVPVLVCEMYQNGRIMKSLFYPSQRFTYNP